MFGRYLLTFSSASARFADNACSFNHFLQLYSWITGECGVQLLLDLTVTYAFAAHTGEFALQILDLPHVWSDGDSDTVGSDDLLALAAVVYMYIKLHLSPQQRYPRNLPEQLAASAALHVRRQPDDVPGLHSACGVQRVVHAEFMMLQQLSCELGTLTPVAWVDIFRQRFTLRQRQLQGDPINPIRSHFGSSQHQFFPIRTVGGSMVYAGI